MKNFILLCIFLYALKTIHAQDTLPAKHTYKSVASTVSNTTVTGYLLSISDSAVFVSSNGTTFRVASANPIYTKIDYSNLSQIKFRRKGATGRGILFGALAGIATGALGGLIDGSDYKKDNSGWCIFCLTAGEKAATLGVAGGVFGGVIGGLVGSLAHKTFIIGGNKQKFIEMKSKLIKNQLQ